MTVGTNTVTATVTRNAASADVQVWYAITTTAIGTRPVEDDPAWRLYQTVTATATADIAPRPSNGRVWARVRSVSPRASGTLLQPSAWAYPTPGSVDPTPIGAIGSLTATEDGSTETYDLAWTNTNADTPVRITVTASGGTARLAAILAGGSTSYRLYHASDPRSTLGFLANSTTYTVAVDILHPDWGAGLIGATVGITTGVAVAPSAASVSASVTDWAPSGNLSNAAITYASSGGTLSVTKNGATVSPGSSPWTVARPAAGAIDAYVFTCTPTNGTATSVPVTVTSNEFLTQASAVTTTRRYGCQEGMAAGSTSSTSFAASGAAVQTTVSTGVQLGRKYLLLPDGSTITGFSYRGKRTNVGEVSRAALYRIDNSAGFTQLGGFAECAATGAYSDAAITGLSEVTSSVRLYCIEFYLNRNSGAQGNVEALWWDVTYTLPTVAAGLG
jgi:hypothetical protein